MNLQKVGFKLFVESPEAFQLSELIPIFHRWIQTGALDGLLIDVADYQHVHNGPGVMLIAHEGNYAMDETGGRRGMLYYRKRGLEGSLDQRLRSVCTSVLRACRQLEEAPELGGRVRFRGDEMKLVTYDRLLAANDRETVAVLRPAFSSLLATLYGGAECTQSQEADPGEPFSLCATAPTSVDVATLLSRLE